MLEKGSGTACVRDPLMATRSCSVQTRPHPGKLHAASLCATMKNHAPFEVVACVETPGGFSESEERHWLDRGAASQATRRGRRHGVDMKLDFCHPVA